MCGGCSVIVTRGLLLESVATVPSTSPARELGGGGGRTFGRIYSLYGRILAKLHLM